MEIVSAVAECGVSVILKCRCGECENPSPLFLSNRKAAIQDASSSHHGRDLHHYSYTTLYLDLYLLLYLQHLRIWGSSTRFHACHRPQPPIWCKTKRLLLLLLSISKRRPMRSKPLPINPPIIIMSSLTLKSESSARWTSGSSLSSRRCTSLPSSTAPTLAMLASLA